MRPGSRRVGPAVTLAVSLIAAEASAEPPRPPAVVVLAESVAAGSSGASLAVLAADGSRRPLLADLRATGLGLAVHAASGRWLVIVHRLAEGAALIVDGRTRATVPDRNTLVFGDGTGALAVVAGDPACTSATRECYETPRGFSADGGHVFVDSEGPSWTTVGRWSFGAGARRATVADRRTAPSLEVAPDGRRAVYLGADGVHVTTWPAQPTRPRARVRQVPATAKAVVTPVLLMSRVWPIGDRLYWFRREPDKQETGWYEAWSFTDRRTTQLRVAAASFPMMRGGFRSTGPRGTVLFPDDTGYERALVLEVGADGVVSPVITDVRAIHDVSADGRYLLVSRRKDPSQGDLLTNPERLVIVDLTTRAEVATLDAGGDGIRILAAGFVLR